MYMKDNTEAQIELLSHKDGLLEKLTLYECNESKRISLLIIETKNAHIGSIIGVFW